MGVEEVNDPSKNNVSHLASARNDNFLSVRLGAGSERGFNNGELGGALIKKRVARAGKGKRDGYMTMVVFRSDVRAVFVCGFPKSARANLSVAELDGYQKLTQVYLDFSDADTEKALGAGELEEVSYDDRAIQE